MGDKIIITDDEPKPEPQIVIVAPEPPKPKIETVVTEKTTVVETKRD